MTRYNLIMLVLFIVSWLSAISVILGYNSLAGVSILSSLLFVALWKNKKVLKNRNK